MYASAIELKYTEDQHGILQIFKKCLCAISGNI